MNRSSKMRRLLVAVALLVGVMAGLAVAAHAGTASDQATCWPTKPGCQQ